MARAAESTSIPIALSLTGSTGTTSKRNFHRPQSNYGMPLNSGCRVFIVLQSRAAAANPSATPINGLSTANQKEILQSEFSGVGFLFMPLFSSVRRPGFQKISDTRKASPSPPTREKREKRIVSENRNRKLSRRQTIQHARPATPEHANRLLECSCDFGDE